MSCSASVPPHEVNSCPLFSATLLTFLSILLMVLLFQMAPRGTGALVPSSVAEYTAVLCLVEEICVLDKLRSGISDSCWP